MSTVFTVRLDDDIEGKFQILCESTNKTRTALISEAVRLYLEQYQDYLQAIEESLKEVEEGLALSHDEVKAYWYKYFNEAHAH